MNIGADTVADTAALSRLVAALAATAPDERLSALKRAVLAHGGALGPSVGTDRGLPPSAGIPAGLWRSRNGRQP